MKKQRISILISSIAVMLLLCACKETAPNSQPESYLQNTEWQEVQPTVTYGPDSYDSEDTAILLRKNTKENTITLYNMQVDKTYTLQVTGTTTLYDKYKEPVSLAQIQPGDIVDVTFLKDIKRLNSMQISEKSWSNINAGRYELDWGKRNLVVGEDVYNLPDDVLLLSEGEMIKPTELNPVDILSFRGINNDVLSITVEKGHGYLKLENDSKFIGGFIEIGQSIIYKIQEDMLLTVPEGSYQVVFSCKGGGGTKNVTIGRNEEVTVDIGDLEVALVQYGTVTITGEPEEMTLYIDGKKVNQDEPITLEYGIHQLIAQAEGYKTMTSYLKVGQASAQLEVTLEQEAEEEKASDSEYEVQIKEPEGVEVYLDGNYIGIAPVSFEKEAGTHTITLRKTGYETRSYTIVVDEEKKDATFSFADLVGTSLSGNTGSLDDTVSGVLDAILYQ